MTLSARSYRTAFIGLWLAFVMPAWSSAEERRTVCGRMFHRRGDEIRMFDAGTGIDPNHFPPDAPVDFIDLKLELEFDDLMSRSFEGRASITFRPVRNLVYSVALDAFDLYIERVQTSEGSTVGSPLVDVAFDYDSRRLFMHFAGPLPIDRTTTVTVDYRCVDPKYGMIFALPDEGYAKRPLMIHTENQCEFGRYWFPSFDSPADRFTSELIVTLPKPYSALSNGALIETVEAGDGNRTFRWRQDSPHASYLVSLVMGDFEVVEDRWRNNPVQYYVERGRGDDAKRTFAQTPRMMELFSTLLNYDYPYAKYSQAAVYLFGWGGLEHTSATTLTDQVLVDARAALDEDEESLIAHELAHQWFGDLITCKSWDHLWLNEGFATFMEWVWIEHALGRDDYLLEAFDGILDVVSWDSADTGVSLVFRDFANPELTFDVKGGLPYGKGAAVLHMLRHQMGDGLFWKSMHEYLLRHGASQVETDDLRNIIESVTGRSWEQFFVQWTQRPGVPSLEVTTRWDGELSLIEFTVKQNQKTTPNRPAFAFPLDVYLRCGADVIRQTLEISGTESRHRMPVPTEPDLYCVDPYAGLPAEIQVKKPREMWLYQLTYGPTLVTRLQAAEHLAEEDGSEAIEALGGVLANTSEHRRLRMQAAATLGWIGEEAVRMLVRAARDRAIVDDPYVRRAVAEALSEYTEDSDVNVILKSFARSDPSINVEATATASLAQMTDEESLVILLENAHKHSCYERIRSAALHALALRGDVRGYDAAFQYATYGHHDRLRPTAIGALARLGLRKELREQARAALIDWLDDPQLGARTAAIEGLAGLDDPESRRALDNIRNSSHDLETKTAVDEALARMDGISDESGPVEILKERISDVRDEVEALTKRIEEMESRLPTQSSVGSENSLPM